MLLPAIFVSQEKIFRVQLALFGTQTPTFILLMPGAEHQRLATAPITTTTNDGSQLCSLGNAGIWGKNGQLVPPPHHPSTILQNFWVGTPDKILDPRLIP